MSNLQQYRKNVIYNAPGDGGEFYASSPSPDSKEQLEQVIDLLHKEKWLILTVFTLVVAAFGAYGYMQQPVYEASSLVMLSGENPGVASGADVLAMAGASSQWGRSPSTELTLLRSSAELPRSVAKRLLAMDPENTPGLRELLTTPEGDTLSHEQFVRRVRAHIGFDATKDGLIQFRSVTPTPYAAALLANTYAQEYVSLTQRVSRASLVASRQFLENQLESKERELQAVEQKIQNYLSDKGALSIEGEGARIMDQVAQMEARQDQIEIEIQRREASIAALRERLNEVQPRLARSVASMASQDIELVQQKIAELKATRQQAIVRHPEWENPDQQPELRDINRQIQRLEETLQTLSEQYVNEIVSAGGGVDSTAGTGGLQQAGALQQQIASEQIAITGLQAELDALEQYTQRYRADLQSIPGESIQIERLQRERARIEQTYGFISQRLQEIRLTEQGELGYASVLTRASIGAANQPQQERLLILGAFVGLLLGMGLALLRHKFDNRLFKPDQIEERGYSVTIVPDMQDLLKSEYKGKAIIEREGRQVSTSLVTLHTATSYATEAYRQLRTNVMYSLSDRSSNVIVVTSAGIGDGKSTTAANLAVAFARAGSRTLLIDADMRRPQLHAFFGLSLEPGLYQLLGTSAEGMAQHVMAQNMESGVENLSVVTAGKVSGADASELVGSGRMQELLGVVRERFDIIIIDTPPALAVTEAKILAPKANATLLVARAGQTREKELDHTVHELERVGSNILGVVLNGFNIDMAYSYRYRYRGYAEYSHYAPAEQ